MQLRLERRAEIAFRSLSPIEPRHIQHALDEISSSAPDELLLSGKRHKVIAASGERLYAYRSSQELRLVLSIQDDSCIIEDVINYRDKLDRLLLKQG